MRPTSLVDEALKHVTNTQLQTAHRKADEKGNAASKEARNHYDNDAKYNHLMNRSARHEGAREEVEGEMRKRVRASLRASGKSHSKKRENVTNTPSQHAKLTQAQPNAPRKVKVKKKRLPTRKPIEARPGPDDTVK